MRKQIKEKDLVPGQKIYTSEGILGTLMEFVSATKHHVYFKDFSGRGLYHTNEEGLVEFTRHQHSWYLPNEEDNIAQNNC